MWFFHRNSGIEGLKIRGKSRRVTTIKLEEIFHGLLGLGECWK
jgi:hypothetical protein